MIRSRVFAALLVAGGTMAAPVALAQAPAAQTPAASGMTAIKHSCTKPGDYPGNLASDTQRRVWQREYLAYQECMKKFMSEQQTLAEPHVKAYNAAVDEYNENIKAFNEQIEKSRR
jgi:hypothetical protein